MVKHGHATGKRSLTYTSWRCMVQRCTNPSHTSFVNYASVPIDHRFLARGGFAFFLETVGKRPTRGHTLDRVNAALGYVPGNLRWATKRQQEKNKARRTFYGRTVHEWARELGVRPTTIRKRLERGWSHDRVFGLVEMKAAAE